ncbi:hypothetical protein tb265_16120 [Gemmatimonadetes bacterium T265]|nr:hypothetical protein tb265_16120 [Gemmatimonadetes bacterium T265]
MTRLRRIPLLRDDRGAAMVEFAMVAPFLFALAFGIIDFGRAYYIYSALNSIAHDGARYGAALSSPDIASIKTHIQNTIVPQYLGALPASQQPAAAGAQISDTVTSSKVVVTITGYKFSPWLPIVAPQTMTIGASATFRREW